MNMKKAFTLAEVLITLAIIGVVAALTIPAVVTKVTKNQYVVALKKAYNTLKSIEREAVQEHGEMKNWDWTAQDTNTKAMEKYFLPHFDVLKNCGTTDTGCFATEGYKYLNSNARNATLNNTNFYKIITSDGIAYAFTRNAVDPASEIWQGYFSVDVNGSKGPNQYGRDLFLFSVYASDLGMKPWGVIKNTFPTVTYHTTQEIDNGCDPTSTTPNIGQICAIKVLAEGAMNY